MKNIELRATVKNGSLQILKNDYIKPILQSMENKELVVVLNEYHQKRTTQQNRWYWGVVIPTIIQFVKEESSREYEKEDIHDYNVTELLRPRIHTRDVLDRQVITYEVKRVSAMTTKEFADFVERLQQHWAERGLVIPDPDQKEFLND
tara:strand:+ start:199 stop:642 length:444 start_codon:yes stop_codon:yes gene_type:complete